MLAIFAMSRTVDGLFACYFSIFCLEFFFWTLSCLNVLSHSALREENVSVYIYSVVVNDFDEGILVTRILTFFAFSTVFGLQVCKQLLIFFFF